MVGNSLACDFDWERSMSDLQFNMFLSKLLNGAVWIIMVLITIVIIVVGPRVESILSPVVPIFDITRNWVEHTPDGPRYFIEGTMVKDRPECRPKSVQLWAGGGLSDPNAKNIEVDFWPDPYHQQKSEEVSLRSRPAGAQHWGPWEIFPPEEPIGPVVTISSSHVCHILWETPSRLAVVDSNKFFPDKVIDE